MYFAHLADCHIGGWKEEKLRALNMRCFQEATKLIIQRNVDFVLLSGDLFNTALPQIDYIKMVTEELKRLHNAKIPVYAIAGSHDYSPSGKTMLDVLEKAGLLINVMKKDEQDQLLFTIDPKTGAKITGLYGKKGGLEISDYKLLDTSRLDQEEGFKIFLFHTAINEFKPKGLEAMHGADAVQLPSTFQYYAGGHVHYVFQKAFGKGVLTYPGALFPNSFKELEEWKHGGVYFCDEQVNWEYVPVKLKEVVPFSIDVSSLNPADATEKILSVVKRHDVKDAIVTLRVIGVVEGEVSDIDFALVIDTLSSAHIVLKNTAKLSSVSYSVPIEERKGSVEEIEHAIVMDHIAALSEDVVPEMEFALSKSLLAVLAKEKTDGEKVADFQQRVLSEAVQVLDIADS